MNNIERLFKIVIGDLSNKLLVLENELERIMNSDGDTEEKIKTIENLLREISIAEFSIFKFTNMLKNNNDNKN